MPKDHLRLAALEVPRRNAGILLLIELSVLVAGLKVCNGTLVESRNWPYLPGMAVLHVGSDIILVPEPPLRFAGPNKFQ